MDKDYLKQFEAGGLPPAQDEAEAQETKPNFKYRVEEHLGILSTNNNGWRLEVNRISYNGRPSKLDIRRISPNGRLSKGIALSSQEEQALRAIFEVNKGE